MTVRLGSDLERSFVAGSSTTTIEADAVEFCRALSGRTTGSIAITGDDEAATRWIEQGCPF